MKSKLFFCLLLFLIFWGCNEEKEIEIIPDYDRIYLPINKLDEIPQLTEGSDNKLIDTILKIYHNLYPIEDTSENKPTMEYKFMINETGSIDKIFMGKNNDEKINQLVLNTVKDWKYKPGIKDGKNVKSQSPMILWVEMQKPVDENEYFIAAEIMPEIIGGLKSIQEKIIYPEIAKRAGIEGKVYILAFIDENGNVAGARVIKGIGAGCDETALNAVNDTKFTPARQQGKPVKVQVTIPISFKLQ
jgi:TonB family protein